MRRSFVSALFRSGFLGIFWRLNSLSLRLAEDFARFRLASEELTPSRCVNPLFQLPRDYPDVIVLGRIWQQSLAFFCSFFSTEVLLPYERLLFFLLLRCEGFWCDFPSLELADVLWYHRCRVLLSPQEENCWFFSAGFPRHLRPLLFSA